MSSPAKKSAEARDRGNGFFKQGLFDHAIKAYFESLKFAPNDHAPLGNLAAVQFELGNYSGSILYTDKALKLLGDEQDTDPRKQKLLLRLAKAYIFNRDLNQARIAVAKLVPGPERESLETSVAMRFPTMGSHEWRLKILDEIPRTKPAYLDVSKFCAVGGDYAEPIYDDELAASKADQLSWMFAGVGDGRNFYRTLVAIPNGESRTGLRRRYHFTLLDRKSTVFARDLVILELLSDFQSVIQRKEALASLIYVFGCQIMPPFAYTKLQETISCLIEKLEAGEPVASWLFLPISHRPAILHQLYQWQRNLGGKFTTRQFRVWGQEQALRDKLRKIHEMIGLPGSVHDISETLSGCVHEIETLPGCEKEEHLFEVFGIMLPNDQLFREHEGEFKKLLDKHSQGDCAPELIEDYVDNHWWPNVTLADLDWLQAFDCHSIQRPEFPMHPNAIFHELHPGEVEVTVRSAQGKGFMTCFETFWRCVAYSIQELKTRLSVEITVCELTDCLERLRYDVLAQRHEAKQGPMDPATFPKVYDRIHLSNIP
ncbi:hypothetical protein F4778DRAFT_526088 [Xylariomycetidae sp. FL2044]|nr:hypothetical protein F4778DRAFT_526088 [Xylariomycetidae sp. FL2044]